MGAPSAVQWAWERQDVWSRTADRLKAQSFRARRLRLTLTIAGAAVALAGSQLAPVHRAAGIALAVVAAVLLAAVGLLGGWQSVEHTRRWTRARAVAEGMKSEVFLFLTRAGTYTGADAEQRLDASAQRLERQAGDLEPWTVGASATSDPPAVHDLDSYLALRVRESQLAGYYEPKAVQLRAGLRIAKTVEVTLALVAAGLAAADTFTPTVGAWAAVVTTAAGAVAAHVAGERYEFLWIEYSRTAGELGRLAERGTAADGRALSGGELIAECERVISQQNRVWLAKWEEDDDPGHGPASRTAADQQPG